MRHIGEDKTTAFVDYVDAYRMEEMGYSPTYNKAIFWTTIDTVNEEPKIAYSDAIIHNPKQTFNTNILGDVVIVPAPTVGDAYDFMRENFGVYIHSYPTMKVVKGEGEGGPSYETTGKFGYTINIIKDGALSKMVGDKEMRALNAGETSEIPEFTGYSEAMCHALHYAIEYFYKKAFGTNRQAETQEK